MIKSKKMLSVVCALTMLLSMFSAFTVVDAAADFKLTADVIEDGKKAGDVVKVKLSYSGLTEAAVSGMQFVIPVDAEVVDTDSLTSTNVIGEITYGGRAGGFKCGFAATKDSERITETASEISTITFALKKDLDKAFDLSFTGVKVINNETSGEVTYVSSDVDTSKIASAVVGKMEGVTINACPVKLIAEVIENGSKAGDVVKVKLSYSGLTEAAVSGMQFVIPVDAEVVDTDSLTSTNVIGEITYGGRAGGFKCGFAATKDAERITETASEISTITFALKKDLEKAFDFNFTGVKVINNETSGEVTYVSSDVDTSKIATAVVATMVKAVIGDGSTSGGSSDPTPTPTPSAPAESPTPTPLPEEDYSVELDVDKDSTLAPGTKIEVTPRLVTGKTYTDTMDIVVQVYNGTAKDEYAIGFVVFKDVAINQTVTFYAPAKATVSVNAVDNISETNANLLGKMVAKKESR